MAVAAPDEGLAAQGQARGALAHLNERSGLRRGEAASRVRGMMTTDEVAVSCGLESFETFGVVRSRFAGAYGCERVGTGRSTWMLCLAIAQALDGKSVLFHCATAHLAERLAQQAHEMAKRAAWPLYNSTRCRIEFASRGFIEFASTAERLLGQRHDSVLRDHYDPARLVDRACLHRVERAKRRCAACELKLRGRKALKLARLRDRMRLADPETWRALGLLHRERCQRLTSAAEQRRSLTRTFTF